MMPMDEKNSNRKRIFLLTAILVLAVVGTIAVQKFYALPI